MDPRHAVIYKLLDVIFTAVAVGIEKNDLMNTVHEMELAGHSVEQITKAIVDMRDAAINKAANA